METIAKLSKTTSSLQSMIMLANAPKHIEAGMFLTTYYHTDRRSVKILEVNGNNILTENMMEYHINKKGEICSVSEFVEFVGVTNAKNEQTFDYQTAHKRYKECGGSYTNSHQLHDIIEGVTYLRKRTTRHTNMGVTINDETYTDPSF